jgi:hypothetical protein
MMRRDSALMPVLRFLQEKYRYFGFLDNLIRPFFNRQGDIGLLCIVAPPRSGSTLTYQVLSSAFRGYSLRNISNFLYATPVIGYLATKKLCGNYESTFCSSHGFVPGMCGEAEGLKFWEHWLGQGLEQNPGLLKPGKLLELKQALDRTGENLMITGYLGNVFAISALRKIFPKVLFIHLQRDILSNSYSLLKLTPDLVPFSTCPAWVKASGYNSRHRLVVDQVKGIHETISAEYDHDMLKINYEDLCDDTHGTLSRIEQKAGEMGITLCRKANVPDSFPKQVVEPDHDEDSARLNRIILKDG